MKKVDLRSCPFCGSGAKIVKADPDDLDGRDTFYVVCDLCECDMGYEPYVDHHIGEGETYGAYYSEQEAASAWNKRVGE